MSRSLPFRNLARAIRIAHYCEESKISTSEGLERAAEIEARTDARRDSRREFLANTGKLAMVGAVGWGASPLRLGLPYPLTGPAVRVAIVGAGLAGLACGDELNRNGVKTTIADNEAKQVGSLYFAGEHTSSFYEFQGFMADQHNAVARGDAWNCPALPVVPASSEFNSRLVLSYSGGNGLPSGSTLISEILPAVLTCAS
jgi:monoamine oxidase